MPQVAAFTYNGVAPWHSTPRWQIRNTLRAFTNPVVPHRHRGSNGRLTHDTRAIQGWLGHRSITSTAIYTALAPNRFKDFWRE